MGLMDNTAFLTQLAAGALAVIKATGSTGTYTQEGQSPITIYLQPLSESRDDASLSNLLTEDTLEDFIIPAQTNFPPSDGIGTNDQLTYPTTAAFTRYVDSWKDISGGAKALFRVSFRRVWVQRLGVKI